MWNRHSEARNGRTKKTHKLRSSSGMGGYRDEKQIN